MAPLQLSCVCVSLICSPLFEIDPVVLTLLRPFKPQQTDLLLETRFLLFWLDLYRLNLFLSALSARLFDHNSQEACLCTKADAGGGNLAGYHQVIIASSAKISRRKVGRRHSMARTQGRARSRSGESGKGKASLNNCHAGLTNESGTVAR